VIPVSPRLAGHIRAVRIQDNQEVAKGDLLVELDPADVAVRLEQARASLRVALARRKAADFGTDLVRVTAQAGVDEAAAALARTRSALETARSQVAAARSRIEQAVAQQATAEANAAQAAAEVVAWEAEVGRAQADAARYQDAVKSRGVSRQQVDQALANARTAEARLEAARRKSAAVQAQTGEVLAAKRAAEASLRQAESQVAEAESRVTEAESRRSGAGGGTSQVGASRSQADASAAEIDLAEQRVRQAELDLSYTRILAPEAGRVTRRTAEEGAYVQVGQALLAIVPKEVWVVANFKESQVAKLRPGQPATVRVDAFGGLVLRGHVASLQAGTGSRFSLLPPENATGNFVKVVQRLPVKIAFDEAPPADRFLAQGMSVLAEVNVP
jgi:membrane fusion protein (multidrug efflux system)